jgi:hypothetical protein
LPHRWGAPGGGGRGAGRELPTALRAVREAVMGMQRSGLPAHLLFSDRDFTAGELKGVSLGLILEQYRSAKYLLKYCILCDAGGGQIAW